MLKLFRKLGEQLSCLSQLKVAGVGPNELVRLNRTCIQPIPEYACAVSHDGLPVFVSCELETVQKTAMGIIFQCFLYEEALVKTSLDALSDRRQARLMDRLFKKILENNRPM